MSRPTCRGAAAPDLAQRLDILRIHLLLLAAGVDVPEAGPVAQVRADVLRAVEALHLHGLDLLHREAKADKAHIDRQDTHAPPLVMRVKYLA